MSTHLDQHLEAACHMRSHDSVETKRRVWNGLTRLARAEPAALRKAALELFAAEGAYVYAHSVNQMQGIDEIIERLWLPM